MQVLHSNINKGSLTHTLSGVWFDAREQNFDIKKKELENLANIAETNGG
jgi:hypothetical protein